MTTTKQHLLTTLDLMTKTARTALEDLNKDAGLMREQIEALTETTEENQK